MIAQLVLLLAAQVTIPDDAPKCIPGAQLACACLGGAAGFQVCEDTGRRLGPCNCPEPEAPASTPRETLPEPPLHKVTATIDLGPRELPYSERVPSGYHVAERTRSSWVEAGLGSSAAVYLMGGLMASLIDAGDPNETSHRWLYLPVAGPFIAAANPEDGEADTFTFVLAVAGVVQVGGLIAAGYGIWSPEKYLLRDDLAITPYMTNEEKGVMLTAALW